MLFNKYHYTTMKVRVWCAVSIWLSIFSENVNSDWYISATLNSFFNELTAEERQYVYTQQDNATVQTADMSMTVEHRIVSKSLWHTRSCNVNCGDYYVSGNLKGKM
jgi:hypothetical protein